MPLRATMSSFGPVLLSKVLGLNEVQESSLGLVLPLRRPGRAALAATSRICGAVLTHLTSDEGKAELKNVGGLERCHGRRDPAYLDHIRRPGCGRVLRRTGVRHQPTCCASHGTGAAWSRCSSCPTCMDQACGLFHLLDVAARRPVPRAARGRGRRQAQDWSSSSTRRTCCSMTHPRRSSMPIAQTVRLIRSKGVGIFFVTQTPKDVPQDVLAQLGVAGAAPAPRAYAERRQGAQADRRHLSQVALRPELRCCSSSASARQSSPVMDPDGAPTPRRLTRMRAPESLMAPTPEDVLRPGIAASALMARVRAIDRSRFRARDPRPEAAGGSRGGGAGASEKEAATQAGGGAKERARAQAQAER